MSRPLVTALLAGTIAAALSCDANALGIDEDGVGQVLIYPYYTVNAGQQTLVTVISTDSRAKAVRLRFLEATNGRAVHAFNIYLAPYDTWTAALVADASGAARVVTNDTSCTVPSFVGDARSDGVFSNASYTGTSRDHPLAQTALDSLTRTREGYVEIIDMGALQTGTGPAQLAEEATALTDSGPVDCAALVAAWQPTTGVWTQNAAASIDLPRGGLYGSAAVVDVAGGAMFSYAATALARFYTRDDAPGALHAAPTAARPTLASADNGGGKVLVELPIAGTQPAAIEEMPTHETFPYGVSLALLRKHVSNDFITDPGIEALTEWVVTMPTKGAMAGGFGEPEPPFDNRFADDGDGCHPIEVNGYARSGRPARGYRNDVILDPPPPFPPSVPSLCFAASVLTVGQSAQRETSALLGSDVARDLEGVTSTTAEPLSAGTIELEMHDPRYPTGTPIQSYRMLVVRDGGWTFRSYRGLPVLGFAVQRVTNSAAQPGLLAVYGGAFPHRTRAEPYNGDVQP
jgi:hypothetical protein